MISRDYLPSIGLGVTQIIGYGSLMYAYAILLPEMAKHLSLSLSEAFGILSLGLFLAAWLRRLLVNWLTILVGDGSWWLVLFLLALRL